jgi:hypothetical protein
MPRAVTRREDATLVQFGDDCGTVVTIASWPRVSNLPQRDGTEACNVITPSQSVKSVDAIRRLECDGDPRFGHDGVKVAF